MPSPRRSWAPPRGQLGVLDAQSVGQFADAVQERRLDAVLPPVDGRDVTADAVGKLLAAQAASFTDTPHGGTVAMQGGHRSPLCQVDWECGTPLVSSARPAKKAGA
jgi:hypothetical protein